MAEREYVMNVRVSPGLSADDVADLRTRLENLLPGVDPVVVAAEQILVFRPDGVGTDA